MRGSRRGPLELAPKVDARTAPQSTLPALASHDEQIQRVQEWNEKLVKTSCKLRFRPASRSALRSPG